MVVRVRCGGESQVWWYMPVIQHLGANCWEFEANLAYIASARPSRAT